MATSDVGVSVKTKDGVTLSVTPAPGADLASETKQTEIKDAIEALATATGTQPEAIAAALQSGTPVPVISDTEAATATALPGSSGAVAAGAAKLWGHTIRETSGSAAAVVRLRDGVVGGAILATIALLPSESLRELWAKPAPVANAAGVYVQIVSGSVEGSVFTS